MESNDSGLKGRLELLKGKKMPADEMEAARFFDDAVKSPMRKPLAA
jgi:hypothetical protein